ncbi:MAG TPA: hypothetical protein VGO62_06745, partial [Myxococcota bacterium]
AVGVAESPKQPPSTGPVAGATFHDAPPVHIVIDHYDFDVRGNLDDAARAQILGADALADAVMTRFRPTAPAADAAIDCRTVGRITVDATRPLGAERNAGQTNWTTVAVDAGVMGRADFAEVIAHETAHVCADVLSRRHLTEKARSTRAFNEGLATVVGEALGKRAAPRFRRVAAFARVRDLVQPDMLFDDKVLVQKVDPNLAYALGAELIRATIDVGGDDAPIRAVAALDLVNKDESGVTLWRDAYQRAGVNLDAVLERFGERLEQARADNGSWLASIPRAFASVDKKGDGELLIKVSYDGALPAGFKPACQARRDSEVGLDEMVTVVAVDGVCHIPSALLPGKADVQVGYVVDDIALFEAWTTVTF